MDVSTTHTVCLLSIFMLTAITSNTENQNSFVVLGRKIKTNVLLNILTSDEEINELRDIVVKLISI